MGGAQKTGFFECTETKRVQCCNDCLSAFACQNGCSRESGCRSGKADVKADCPTMLDYPGTVAYGFGETPPNITYKCTNEDGFYKDIAEKYGIEKSWFAWSKRRVMIHNSCQYVGADSKNCQVISGNYTQMHNLKIRMENESKNAALGTVSRGDVVDAGSLPALMMRFAITSVNKVVETANKIEEQERKSMIANFLMAFMMFIPMVGATADALGSTLLRTIINVAGELANIGIAIYEVVDDPDNALMTVFGLLLGGATLSLLRRWQRRGVV